MSKIWRRRSVWLIGIVVAALVTSFVLSRSVAARSNVGAPLKQTTSDSTGHTITVSGQGAVQVTPDQAALTVGVQTRADTAQAASSDNATKMTAVINAIEALGIPAKNITTSQLSIYFDTEKSQYVVSNNVTVTIDDISIVGKVLDAAVTAGANASYDLNFGLKDPTAANTQALKAAVANARQRADTIAGSLGVTISGVGSAQSTSYNVVPVYAAASKAAPAPAAAPPPPVSGGQLTVTADVTVVYTF